LWDDKHFIKQDAPSGKLFDVWEHLIMSQSGKKLTNQQDQILEADITGEMRMAIRILMTNFDTHYIACDAINPVKGAEHFQKSGYHSGNSSRD
jgi:hypothetical protein